MYGRTLPALLLALCPAVTATPPPELGHLSRFSSWAVDAGLESSSVSGGLSNRNFLLRVPGAGKYIMRVPGDLTLPPEHNYSRIHLVNRSMEAR